ncbi:unnamed protein product [Timema podura]|uniref:Uncharacterized protein n=1 Tax=Timema podura TaxID=61482 RepID=A0ABN7NMV3_TIMPD|nr:unnamed protein product [Timema podura]
MGFSQQPVCFDSFQPTTPSPWKLGHVLKPSSALKRDIIILVEPFTFIETRSEGLLVTEILIAPPLRAKGVGGGTRGKGGCNVRGVELCGRCINTGRISHDRQTLGEPPLSQFYTQHEDCTSIHHEDCGWVAGKAPVAGGVCQKPLPPLSPPSRRDSRGLLLSLFAIRRQPTIVVLALFVCSFAAELEKKGEAEKSVDKRGVLGLGYGYGDYGGYGGYGGYGHGLSYAAPLAVAAAPIAIAAPVSTVSKVSYGTTHLGGYGYGLGGYGLGYGYASAPLYTAPAVTKVSYAAPALSYASPLDHGFGYSGLGYHGLGYSAPLSLGYGSYGYHH